jgi:hypothetical protein
MPRPDLLEQSAPRVELDQRSREARLRLEHVERLLVVRPSPRQSLLKRVLHCLGSRIYIGEKGQGGAANTMTSGRDGLRGVAKPGEASGAADSVPAASPFAPPNCVARARSRSVRTGYGWPVAPRCRQAELRLITPAMPRFEPARD